jgi:hypothetical protein
MSWWHRKAADRQAEEKSLGSFSKIPQASVFKPNTWVITPNPDIL